MIILGNLVKFGVNQIFHQSVALRCPNKETITNVDHACCGEHVLTCGKFSKDGSTFITLANATDRNLVSGARPQDLQGVLAKGGL